MFLWRACFTSPIKKYCLVELYNSRVRKDQSLFFSKMLGFISKESAQTVSLKVLVIWWQIIVWLITLFPNSFVTLTSFSAGVIFFEVRDILDACSISQLIYKQPLCNQVAITHSLATPRLLYLDLFSKQRW